MHTELIHGTERKILIFDKSLEPPKCHRRDSRILSVDGMHQWAIGWMHIRHVGWHVVVGWHAAGTELSGLALAGWRSIGNGWPWRSGTDRSVAVPKRIKPVCVASDVAQLQTLATKCKI
jgi:hypothetical protein